MQSAHKALRQKPWKRSRSGAVPEAYRTRATKRAVAVDATLIILTAQKGRRFPGRRRSRAWGSPVSNVKRLIEAKQAGPEVAIVSTSVSISTTLQSLAMPSSIRARMRHSGPVLASLTFPDMRRRREVIVATTGSRVAVRRMSSARSIGWTGVKRPLEVVESGTALHRPQPFFRDGRQCLSATPIRDGT